MNLKHLPLPSKPAPAELLSQFCPSSNHHTFPPLSQHLDGHPDNHFTNNTKWMTRGFHNLANEFTLMMNSRCNPLLQDQPQFINQLIRQSFTSVPAVSVVSAQHTSAASCIKLPPFEIPKLMRILSLLLIGSTFSKSLFTMTDQFQMTESHTCKTSFPERRKTLSEVSRVTLFSTSSHQLTWSLASIDRNTLSQPTCNYLESWQKSSWAEPHTRIVSQLFETADSNLPKFPFHSQTIFLSRANHS